MENFILKWSYIQTDKAWPGVLHLGKDLYSKFCTEVWYIVKNYDDQNNSCPISVGAFLLTQRTEIGWN
jgi:hypothetical protein